MVAEAARDDLEAVADQVVLERLDGERILVFQRVHAALRHRERIVREVDLLLVLVPLVEREVDDPGEFEGVLVDEAKLLRRRCCARRRRICRTSAGSPAAKKHRIAIFKAELRADRFGSLRPDVLGDRASAFERFAFGSRQKM